MEESNRPTLPDRKKLSTEEYLEAMGRICVEMHNHDPDEMATVIAGFCSPGFRVTASYPNCQLLAANLQDYLANIKAFRNKNPNYHVKSTNLTVEVDEPAGRAELISTLEAKNFLGADENLVREAVYRSRWKRTRKGDWEAYQLEILRGPGVEGIL